MAIMRRDFLAMMLVAPAMTAASPTWALDQPTAEAHVRATIEEIKAMLKTPGQNGARAPVLRRIMESRANVPQLAKFSAGRSWRDMNDDQRERFIAAFSKSISIIYARRFEEYNGEPEIEIGETVDFGTKGILVRTPVNTPDGKKVAVEWLVTDRAGSVQIVDLIIEGISMAAQQREEIGAKLDKRGGDVELLISDLEETS